MIPWKITFFKIAVVKRLWYTLQLIMIIIYSMIVTVRQAYAFTADTVRKRRYSRKKSIIKGDFAWISVRKCEGTE